MHDRPEKNRPAQTVVERYIQLKGYKFVDEIIGYVKGQGFTGRTYCEEKGIEL